MRCYRPVVAAFVAALVLPQIVARADEASPASEAAGDLEAVMLDVTNRELPSDEEWAELHKDVRGGLTGSLSDLRGRTVSFCDMRYLTANAMEGTLASYGKSGKDKRYDRFGHIQGVEFSIDDNSWKQHHVVNAAALLKLAGNRRFEEFAGVGFDVAAEKKQQIEVTFVGTMVPKDEAVRRLNSDIEALEYLNALRQERAAFEKKSFKLLAGDPPPAPKVVLANVVMLNGNFSKALDASVDGKLHSRIVGVGVELKVVKNDGQSLTLLSPVVRCYRTYTVDFRRDDDGRILLATLKDRQGAEHHVPQVFDLTPDL